MIVKNVNLPIVTCVEENILASAPKLIYAKGLVFTNPLVVTGRGRTKAIGEQLLHHIVPKALSMTVRDASLAEMERIRKRIIDNNVDSLFSVGGGKVIDAGKCAAFSCGINFIAIPTAVSNDGIASPVAVIENGGRTESRMTAVPTALIADLSIIKSAPASTTKSGIGDLISNISATLDWEMAAIKKREPFDSFTASMSKSAAIKLLDNNYNGTNDLSFLRSLIEGLIMSGMAMAIHGSSRPSSGAEHMISHAIDALYNRPGSHGEQCGIATLFTLALHRERTEKIRSVFQNLKLKTKPSDLGLSKKDFLKAVIKAPSMRPGRFSILDISDAKSRDRAYSVAFE